jgi:hypothetical protein
MYMFNFVIYVTTTIEQAKQRPNIEKRKEKINRLARKTKYIIGVINNIFYVLLFCC